jgi:hypothetical protein
MSGRSHSHVGLILFYSNDIKMEIDRVLDDDLNLRSRRVNREKWSIFGWEDWGMVCGYSMLQYRSPRMCRLMTVCSGTLSEHLNCTDVARLF